VKSPRSSRRRLALAVVVTFVIVGIFTVRLVDIQLVRATQLNAQSTSKRAITSVTYAPRGQIVDANGVVLADSVNRYDITAAPVNVRSFERKSAGGAKTTVSVTDAAAEIANLTKQDPAAVYLDLTKNPKSNYVLLASSVTTATMKAITNLGIPGIYHVLHPARAYPDGAVAGNLVGYMNTDGPGGGLEYSQNKCLASTNGSTKYEQGADGVQIPGSTVSSTPAKPGGTLKLTTDSDLQWFAQQAIAQQATAVGAQSATSVVLRVKDFHLMAVADWPSVDPNNLNATPAQNRGALSFTDQYEPGSVFKAMSAAMLIDTGIGSPTMQATVPSTWHTPEGGTVHDAAPHPVQHLTLTGVLQNSSNVGISMLGSQVPKPVRYDYMKKFGLTVPTAVNFLGEAGGSLAPWQKWDDQTKYNVLYGQGVSATALQVAQIFGILANGGVKLPLTLVQSCTRPDGTITGLPSTTGTRVVKDSTAKTVVNMLESVVQGGELSNAVKIPGYRVAGKSGTAEVAGPGGYGSDRVVSFAGIAPADDPQYVVVVTYTKPATMKSSAAAAPTFKKIMSQVLAKYGVPPSTTPLNDYPATTW
jgi:cell division protein FtsI (penicillin-binding protein 3)